MVLASSKNRQSYGLTLPYSDGRDSVVGNILSSLATLDETAQLQWIQETSRQVDNERAYQRRESVGSGYLASRNRQYGRRHSDDISPVPITGVGYKDRGVNGSFSIINTSAPSPAVPMGRPTRQGFFRRFMGIGPRIQIENDVILTQQPKPSMKTATSVRVPSPKAILIIDV